MTGTEENVLATRLRQMQLIIAALIVGAALFLGGLVVGRHSKVHQPPNAPPVLGAIALGYAGLALVARTIVPGLMTSAAVRRMAARPPGPADEEVASWCGEFQTRLILTTAILEGAALFLGVAYFLTGAGWLLGAAALMLFAMAAGFPTQSGLSRWVEAQRDRALSRRQESGEGG